MSIKKYRESINEVIRLKDKPKNKTVIEAVTLTLERQKDIYTERNLTLWENVTDMNSKDTQEVMDVFRRFTRNNNRLIDLIKMDMRIHRPAR